MTRKCEFPECERKHEALGLCSGHYQQRKSGAALSPINSKRRPSGTPPRIEFVCVPCKISGVDGDCHQWTKSQNDGGYGHVGIGRKVVLVHRYVWERDVGEIPEGMVIDHKCKNRLCCNVSHLRVVTEKINATENSDGPTAINASKTHCVHGHPFDEANTYWKPDGGRQCLSCRRRIESNRPKGRRQTYRKRGDLFQAK